MGNSKCKRYVGDAEDDYPNRNNSLGWHPNTAVHYLLLAFRNAKMMAFRDFLMSGWDFQRSLRELGIHNQLKFKKSWALTPLIFFEIPA